MKRLIKFRLFEHFKIKPAGSGEFIDSGKMYYISSLHFNEYGGIKYVEIFDENGIEGMERKEGGILMQFTGLKDKNGKDIWEGDILHETWWKLGDENLGLANGVKRVVTWEIKQDSDNEYCNDGFVGFEGFPISHFFEVIGNIYENPELVK